MSVSLEQQLSDLQQRNQLLQAEIERLRVYKEWAYTDPLTEVPNRRFYYERLLQEIARTRRHGHALSLALLDLDRFKSINERIGHRGGDQALKFFSQFVRSNLRQEDIFCRIGGDEFAIIFPDSSVDEALIALQRVRKKLSQIEVAIDGRLRVALTFSCGLGGFKLGYLAEDLIEEADHSLYTAKAKGRDRVVRAPMDRGIVQAQLVSL